MSAEPRNEQSVCLAVVRLLEKRFGEPMTVTARPDVIERNQPAVELLFESATRKFAMEHTRIESFPNQIADGATFAGLLEPLEAELAGQLPAHFTLVVDVGATARIRRDQQQPVRDAIREWILANASALAQEAASKPRISPRIHERVRGVPFALLLICRQSSRKELRLFRSIPEDLETLRAERLRTSVAKKFPKLQAHKASGRETVLVFESNDIALANVHVIAEGLSEALRDRDDVPDHILVVGTELADWEGWILKEGERSYPNVLDYGPVDLD